MEKLLIMYDLPHKTKQQRKIAGRFRRKLIQLGFNMLQYSIYLRIITTQNEKENIISQVKQLAPKQGTVRIISLTESEYAKMNLLSGEKLPIENTFTFPNVIEL